MLHVSAALDHLADELVVRKAHSDSVERRSPLAPKSVQRVAVAALLRLKNKRAPPFKSGASLQIFQRNGIPAPRIHHWTPRCMQAQLRKSAERDRNQQDREH